MRAFTAAFGNIKIRARVQIFMLQGMSQPVSAGGYEETFPRGQVLQLPFRVSARGLQPGLERPHIRQDATAAALVPPPIPLNGPQTPFSQLILSPLDSQGAAGHGVAEGAGHIPQPSPCPRHLAPSCSFPFFFFVSHLSFRSLFR